MAEVDPKRVYCKNLKRGITKWVPQQSLKYILFFCWRLWYSFGLRVHSAFVLETVFLFCCSTWWTQDLRRFLTGKGAAPEAIQICSSETLVYSPIYITSFLTFESATWLCFWLMTFVLWCFALVLFFGFLFSVPMLGWLHVSLGLELVYLRLAHVLVPVIVLVFA